MKTWVVVLAVLAAAIPMAYAGGGAVHAVSEAQAPDNLIARLKVDSPEEIEQILRRAESYLETAEQYPDFEPIAFVLHGPEIQVFSRKNYDKYKDIVGLAARLEAFEVIDVQVCEVQLKRQGVEVGELPAFVDTVPFGPDREEELVDKGYRYF